MNFFVRGLAKTRARMAVADDSFAILEDALIAADVGVTTAADIVREAQTLTGGSPRDCLAAVLERRLLVLSASLNTVGFSPFVIVVMGTNGGGKTTTIAKLCRYFARQRKSVLLAAGDTFRAAAREQLREWAIKLGGVEMVDFSGAPAAVAYDAAVAGAKRGTDIVLVDTAGRLPSQPNLMAELAKIRRATAKAIPGGPHELLLVLDASLGQNALVQLEAFSEAAGVTGLVVTKLDGSAKGGFLLALAAKSPKPVRFIGVGEGADDLAPFDASGYAQALVGVGNAGKNDPNFYFPNKEKIVKIT